MFQLRELLILVSFFGLLYGARILGIAGIPSYSHQLFYRPIWLELAKRGHDLTLLTTDPIEDAPNNIRQIDWHFAYEIRHNKHNTTMKMEESNFNIIKNVKILSNMIDDVALEEMNHPDVQTLIRNESEKFDLVMTEVVPFIFSAFSVRFKCPYITMFSADIPNFYLQMLGNPLHPVLHSDFSVPNHHNANLKETVLNIFYQDYINHIYLSTTDAKDFIIKHYFGEGYPPLKKILTNVSMVFVNSHPIFNVKPLGPGFVRIGGGMHMKKKKELPKEIKEFLDSADQGAIYFSLGTNVRSHHIAESFLKTAVTVFKELPYKILWKLESDLPEKSSNVKIFKWLPQQDVLRHKNVKLFITQCGAQSLEESILAKVPLLGIPFISDQKMNANHIVKLGIGKQIDRTSMTNDILKKSIIEMMTNSSYYEKVKEAADLLLDEPMSSLDKAVWWTEYVIRHKGAKHFWHPYLDLPFYQDLYLVVIGLLLVNLIMLPYILFKMFQIILRLVRKCKSTIKEKTS